jgi:hypothetical protein
MASPREILAGIGNWLANEGWRASVDDVATAMVVAVEIRGLIRGLWDRS